MPDPLDVSPRPPIPDDYLGDGVYASFDGYNVVLDLRAQDNFTKIALEPCVMMALVQYYNKAHQIPEQN